MWNNVFWELVEREKPHIVEQPRLLNGIRASASSEGHPEEQIPIWLAWCFVLVCHHMKYFKIIGLGDQASFLLKLSNGCNRGYLIFCFVMPTRCIVPAVTVSGVHTSLQQNAPLVSFFCVDNNERRRNDSVSLSHAALYTTDSNPCMEGSLSVP